jgi:Flp pilus assembly protein protease CpaA
MLGFVFLAIGIVGFGLAAYWDLRYTEFPDWLPYSIIILTIAAKAVFSYAADNWLILGTSVFYGCVFLGLGLLLYFAKQWGDGDAWLLGALGFVLPDQLEFGVSTNLPFPMTLLFNFLLVSLVYLIAYSLVLGLRNRTVNKRYAEHLYKERYKLMGMTAFFFAFCWGFAFFMHYMGFNAMNVMQMAMLPFLLTFILLFSYYAKIVEKNLFKRKVKTSELREGDVILDGRWRGLTKKEIAEIRRKGKYAWIKEGVRFAPVFIITMLISIFYGDLILILV